MGAFSRLAETENDTKNFSQEPSADRLSRQKQNSGVSKWFRLYVVLSQI